MQYSGTWKEIWTQKGEMVGTKDDIVVYDGWESAGDKMKETALNISKFLDIKPTDRVLEIGCGAGGLGQYLECDYVGVDFSEPLTKRCMEFYGLPAIYAEANDIPFKDAWFDKCFSWGVFLYFPSREYGKKVIEEMVRVTKESDVPHIFIGDVPIKSHNKNHMLYDRTEIESLGMKTTDGWVEPYLDSRFNAWR